MSSVLVTESIGNSILRRHNSLVVSDSVIKQINRKEFAARKVSQNSVKVQQQVSLVQFNVQKWGAQLHSLHRGPVLPCVSVFQLSLQMSRLDVFVIG